MGVILLSGTQQQSPKVPISRFDNHDDNKGRLFNGKDCTASIFILGSTPARSVPLQPSAPLSASTSPWYTPPSAPTDADPGPKVSRLLSKKRNVLLLFRNTGTLSNRRSFRINSHLCELLNFFPDIGRSPPAATIAPTRNCTVVSFGVR